MQWLYGEDSQGKSQQLHLAGGQRLGPAVRPGPGEKQSFGKCSTTNTRKVHLSCLKPNCFWQSKETQMRGDMLTFWILSLKLWKPYTPGRKLQPELGCHHHLSEARASFPAVRQASLKLHIPSQVWWLRHAVLAFGRLKQEDCLGRRPD